MIREIKQCGFRMGVDLIRVEIRDMGLTPIISEQKRRESACLVFRLLFKAPPVDVLIAKRNDTTTTIRIGNHTDFLVQFVINLHE